MPLKAVESDTEVLAAIKARYQYAGRRISTDDPEANYIRFQTNCEFVSPQMMYLEIDVWKRMGQPEYIDVKITPIDALGKPLHQ